MRNRKLILGGILTLAVLVAASGAVVVLGDSGKPVRVEGNLSSKDVAEIKALVIHQRRKEVMPALSWGCVRALPNRFKEYRSYRIDSIRRLENTEQVVVELLSTTNIPRQPGDPEWISLLTPSRYYRVVKESGTWRLQPFFRCIW